MIGVVEAAKRVGEWPGDHHARVILNGLERAGVCGVDLDAMTVTLAVKRPAEKPTETQLQPSGYVFDSALGHDGDFVVETVPGYLIEVGWRDEAKARVWLAFHGVDAD